MYHPLRDQGIDPNEFPESEVMTIDVLPKWAYTNHPVKLTYDRKEDPNVPLSVVRSKEIEAINEYLASITAGLAAANARIAELEAQLAAAISHPVPTAQEFVAEVMRLRAEVARLQALWDAVQKIDGWRDSHLLDGIYFCTGSKWHAGGDSALLGKGNGALELNWRGLWEPRHEDDVTVEVPTMREVIIALAAKLEEEA